MPSAHQNWQSLGINGLYGTNTGYGNSLYGGNMPVTRDSLDAARLGQTRVPSAEYPDGYLGTMRTRREDRTLDSLKNRANQRSYQRGVHKGERIDPSDYFYPEGLDPMRGLRAEAAGRRQAPLMTLAPAPHLVNDGKADVRANEPAEVNAARRTQLTHLSPTWK